MNSGVQRSDMLDGSIGQSRAVYRSRELSAAIAASFWRHRYLYAVSLASLALAVVVGLATGNLPDFGVIEEFGFYLLVAFWIGASVTSMLLALLLWRQGRAYAAVDEPVPVAA